MDVLKFFYWYNLYHNTSHSSFSHIYVGRTPWDTWISCEEVINDGQIWEVDPLGVRKAKKTVLGGINTGGRFESFTYDVRNQEDPRFYYTEDRPNGPLRRFRPTNPDWSEPYKMLHGTGEIEFLVLNATASDNSTGTYSWTKNKTLAEASAAEFFPGSEGIDAYEGSLYFVSKKANLMYVLNLDGNTWESRSTVSGVFDGSPDQLTRLVGEQEILYYTEVSEREERLLRFKVAQSLFSCIWYFPPLTVIHTESHVHTHYETGGRQRCRNPRKRCRRQFLFDS